MTLPLPREILSASMCPTGGQLEETLRRWQGMFPLFYDGCTMPDMEKLSNAVFWLEWVLTRFLVRYEKIWAESSMPVRLGGGRLSTFAERVTVVELAAIESFLVKCERSEKDATAQREFDARLLNECPLAGTW